MRIAQHLVARTLQTAGVTINGKAPWDIRVHDARMYARVLIHGSLGLGEAYMDGWWDAPRVDLFIERLLRSGKHANEMHPALVWLRMQSAILNVQSKMRARRVIDTHYNLGNDFYALFLDQAMQYSCGYFKNTEDLEIAQQQKMDLICRKLKLTPGQRVLDVGCGWGGLAQHMAEKHGVSVVGITLSHAQADEARVRAAKLPIEIRVMDYRDIPSTERFDRIVSVAMFEHVGPKNYRTFMQRMRALLAPDGMMLLHTVGQNASLRAGNPWVDKYIFPGGTLPSLAQISRATENLFVTEDVHNFGPDYHKTLRAWDERFAAHQTHIEEKYGERFYRMFRYFFNSFAGAFKARRIHLWQIVLSTGASDATYIAER